MRPATACLTCRLGKRHCTPSKSPGSGACARCERMKVSCSLVPPTSSGSELEVAPRLIPAGLPVLENIDPALKEDMAWHYFTVVHDQHHSIFHRPTFEACLRRNSVPDVLLLGVLALGSRFTTVSGHIVPSSPERRELGNRLAERAVHSLDMRQSTLTTVQACILLGSLCFADGNADGEVTYYASAGRLAQVLDLPKRHSRTSIEHEVNLRVCCSLYMADVWASAGLELPRQVTWTDDLSLPAKEEYFLSLAPDMVHKQWPESRDSPQPGIWGKMTQLTCIWAKIQDFNKASVQPSNRNVAQALQIDDLEQELAEWRNGLPPFLQETKENLERAAQLGVGPSFAALHLGYHYYHEVLFYQLMGESHSHTAAMASPSPTSILQSASSRAAKCAAHARAFCDLLYECERTEGCRCLYAMVGHMLVVTSTVLMHVLFFDQQQGREQGQLAQYRVGIKLDGAAQGGAAGREPPHCIRERLRHNFEILTELQQHWSSLDASLARLQVFHNACLYSIEHSFEMDQWMLKFILEHGKAMPERFAVLPDGSTKALPGSSDAAGQGGLKLWYSEALL